MNALSALISSPALLFGAVAAAALTLAYLFSSALRVSPPRRAAVLHAIGTATPPRSLTGAEFLGIVKTLDYPEEIQGRIERVVASSGISRRFCVSSTPVPEYVEALCKEGARSSLWNEGAPQLAVAASRDALARWRHGSASDITHVVVHSCTGFAAPGLDFEIIQALGLRSSTRKIGVNFMGWCVATGKRRMRAPPAQRPSSPRRPNPPPFPPPKTRPPLSAPQLWRHDGAVRG